jgi:hypothetical protein
MFIDKLSFIRYKDYSFEQLAELPTNKILLTWYDGMFKCIILRGPCSLCTYVGVPIRHDFNKIENIADYIDCHWGVSFLDTSNFLGDGYMWYGSDYGHSGDCSFYNLKNEFGFPPKGKMWVLNEVEAETKEVVLKIKKLIYYYE